MLSCRKFFVKALGAEMSVAEAKAFMNPIEVEQLELTQATLRFHRVRLVHFQPLFGGCSFIFEETTIQEETSR